MRRVIKSCTEMHSHSTMAPIPLGALAHLVERNNGIVEVIGSSPIRSIFFKEAYVSV